jgi:hypothetical protein
MVLTNHIQGAMASLFGANADPLFRFKPVWKWYKSASDDNIRS